MLFEDLATELVVHVFLSCNSVTDVTALSSTCRRFRNIYSSSQKLPILEIAAETQLGPLEDLNQLLTHNASQPAHIVRSVPFSLALLKQIVQHGRVAEKWCDIYPFKKWKHNFESRRLLTAEERYRVRRAIYRSWLYSRAFHNRDHPREFRAARLVLLKRAALLHNWSTWELAEIADVHSVIREVVQTNVCPSNNTITRKFKKRHPGNEHSLLFNIHLNYPPTAPQAFNPFTPNPLTTHFHNTPTYTSRYASSKYSLHHEVGAEGWGDDIPHYYVIEDYMKLDPAQILYLKEHAPLKSMVESYVRSLCPEYDWFTNNGETWVQTLEFVLEERGEDVGDFMGAIADGELGVAVCEMQVAG
ncbi:F-box domain containing protein [Pyrenophora tritici-repentis]|nr:F-box domain-containing protein [Pyrenophora tritici-repentis]KAI0608374.1 F-box domain-containing protein [Pyrenophora tritici-repentis]KAI0620642.1 F-box domain-containing protein [Pyrenophora tritici-repentis]KAI2487423.1 F-box domain containing protein [Pyrenophora tritici-repentis]